MFLYSAQMSMHVAKWIYWWSPNKQSLTTACTQGEKAQWAGFWVKQGENNLKNHEGLNWSWTRARVSKHRASNNKAGRNTTALSVLANEEHQDVPGFCSAMIHTVKLIKRGPWEAFGCNKLLPPKHHSGMAQRLQDRATSQQAAHTRPPWFGSCRMSPLWHGPLSVPGGPGAPKHPVCPGRCTCEWVLLTGISVAHTQ